MREQPLLSIVFPTRGRHVLLERVIKSLQDNWGKEMQIEICIKVDLDDTESIRELQKHLAPNIRILISDREEGYRSLPEYFNDLINISNGIFVVIWNDDSILIKPGNLKELLLENINRPCFIASSPTCNFPVFHYTLLEWLRQRYGYRGSDTLFGDVLFVDGYFHELSQKVPNIMSKEYSTFEYGHVMGVGSGHVREFQEDAGYGSWEETSAAKDKMRLEQDPRGGHPRSRIDKDWPYYEKKLRAFKALKS